MAAAGCPWPCGGGREAFVPLALSRDARGGAPDARPPCAFRLPPVEQGPGIGGPFGQRRLQRGIALRPPEARGESAPAPRSAFRFPAAGLWRRTVGFPWLVSDPVPGGHCFDRGGVVAGVAVPVVLGRRSWAWRMNPFAGRSVPLTGRPARRRGGRSKRGFVAPRGTPRGAAHVAGVLRCRCLAPPEPVSPPRRGPRPAEVPGRLRAWLGWWRAGHLRAIRLAARRPSRSA